MCIRDRAVLMRSTHYDPQTAKTIIRPADIRCNCHERPKFGQWLWSVCHVQAFPVTPKTVFENEVQ
eukprot:11553410-Prorocentrum_lima.AAC.1